jgi:uncharacterized protein (UPF0332 family)
MPYPKFHRYLLAAQDLRQVGDYGIEKNVSESDARQVIAWSEEFLKSASELLG